MLVKVWKDSIFQRNTVKYFAFIVFMEDLNFRHPRGKYNDTPPALDPNNVYQVQNSENPCYNKSKSLSKLLPLLRS